MEAGSAGYKTGGVLRIMFVWCEPAAQRQRDAGAVSPQDSAWAFWSKCAVDYESCDI